MPTLTFKNNRIRGSTTAFNCGSPDIPLRRFNYWDVRGEAEIIGKQSGRSIIVQHLFFGNYQNWSRFEEALDELDAMIGVNAKLEFTTDVDGDAYVRQFKNTTFDKWEPVALAGQSDPGPLKDIAGTLFEEGLDEPDEGWFLPMTLYFRQLLT